MLFFRLFVNVGGRNRRYLLRAEFACAGSQMCFMEMLVILRESHFDRRTLMFYTVKVDFSFVQMNQFPYKHQPDAASGHFGVDCVASPEMYLE